MRAINHALTGAVIGVSATNPALAVPLAFVSHFALDALPHYNPKGSSLDIMRNKWFLPSLVLDALLCFGLVIVLIVLIPGAWFLPAICAFVATSPDFLSIGRFVTAVKDNRIDEYKSTIMQFAERIQWFQRPIGGLVEITWAISTIYVLTVLLS